MESATRNTIDSGGCSSLYRPPFGEYYEHVVKTRCDSELPDQSEEELSRYLPLITFTPQASTPIWGNSMS